MSIISIISQALGLFLNIELTFHLIFLKFNLIQNLDYTMSVTEKDVQYIANLARLQVNEEEAKSYAKDMSSILEYMELLNEVDTSDVKPLEHVIDLESRFRKDKAEQPLSHEDALKNAPDADSDYFRVPKVIE